MKKPKTKLTNAQRITAMVCRPVWQKLSKAGVIEESFDDWRHRECLACCGHHLSEAPKKLHDEIEAHFRSLGGDTGGAYQQLTGKENAERQQRYVIADLAKKLNVSDPESYAQSLQPHQLKGVIINLKANLKQRSKQPA
jgi:hypothetical protein